MEQVIAVDSVTETQDLDFEAAKQLRVELAMIKSRILSSGTLMNSILVTQLKMVLRGLLKKYNDAGLLKGENVTLVLDGRGRYAGFRFVYSQGLQLIMKKVEDDAKKEIEVKQPEKEVDEKPC